MTVVIHKKAYYTDNGEKIGPVEVYDKDHQFVGIVKGRTLIAGHKVDGYFIPSDSEEKMVALGDRQMFAEKKTGVACYEGYNEKCETETRFGFPIWKEDLAEMYGRTSLNRQAKIKKMWSLSGRCRD